MTKTIELTELVIGKIYIDYTAQVVKVEYQLLDNNGDIWSSGTAFFWVTLPSEPTPRDFQLPAEYITTLIQMRNDADAALTARFLI